LVKITGIFGILLILIILINSTTLAGKISFNNEIKYDIHPIMEIDFETFEKLRFDIQNAEEAYFKPILEDEISTTSSFSILNYLNYIPSERDQGWCQNCWVWPATGIMGIALYVQEGIFERLSVQYINSCGTLVGYECCEGGNLNIFTNFYRNTDKTIPWSNENAYWQDKFAQCRTSCESISTEPNYPIQSIVIKTIETHDITEEEAISNIKNILHQEKGVYFSWYLPDLEYRQDFSEFWDEKSEDYIYDLDWDCGGEFLEDEGGGHAVLCVGYVDEEGTNNDYWIMLNSWGTTSRRPNALFAVNMHMDYDCTILYEDHEFFSFDFQTLNISFGSQSEAPEPPLIQGTVNGRVNTEYIYQISTIDNQEDDVYFFIDWDDGETEEWIGPTSSGQILNVTHFWDERGSYIIKVKAKDTNDFESFWSTFEVSMPKYKINNNFPKIILWILELFPYFNPFFFN
jgi:hypothetical protein